MEIFVAERLRDLNVFQINSVVEQEALRTRDGCPFSDTCQIGLRLYEQLENDPTGVSSCLGECSLLFDFQFQQEADKYGNLTGKSTLTIARFASWGGAITSYPITLSPLRDTGGGRMVIPQELQLSKKLG